MRYIELLNGVKEEWSITEKARYLYQEICKNIFYDERFAYGKDKELLHTIYDRKINIREDESPRVICHTANKIYYQLLSELGIKAKIIYKTPTVERPITVDDVALIFWDENGDKIFTNIVGDIQNCKYGVRTAFFGITKNLYKDAQDVKMIPLDKLKQIDIKIGVIKQDYYDFLFQLLANEVKNTNNFKNFLKGKKIDVRNLSDEDILKYKIQYISDLIKFRDKTAGPDERKKFYKRLFSAAVLDKFESQKFNAYEFVKEYKKDVDVLSVIEINLSDNPIYYVYSESEQTYVQVLPEELLPKIKGYTERKGKKILIQNDDNKTKDYEGEEH